MKRQKLLTALAELWDWNAPEIGDLFPSDSNHLPGKKGEPVYPDVTQELAFFHFGLETLDLLNSQDDEDEDFEDEDFEEDDDFDEDMDFDDEDFDEDDDLDWDSVEEEDDFDVDDFDVDDDDLEEDEEDFDDED